MTLFVKKHFISHNNLPLSWKVECDALNPDDWEWAAARTAERFSFCDVYGIPQGGTIFEKHLRPYIRPDGDFFLIVDDVLTTGDSMDEARHATRTRHSELPRIGVVLFARVRPPVWIAALWQLW